MASVGISRWTFEYEHLAEGGQRTGSRFAQRQIERPRRLALVADLCVRRHSVRFCHSNCRIAMSRHCKSRSGLTLLEMLAVIAIIISLLASLLLGAVHKAHARAKDRVWRLEAPGFISLIQERLSKYYQSQITYPAWTADDLYRRHVFDDRIMEFLRSPKVAFIPFSSTDPDDKRILRVVNIWPEEKSPIGLLKTSVTKPE